MRRGDLQQDLLLCLLPTAAPGGAARPWVHPLAPKSAFYSHAQQLAARNAELGGYRTISVADGLFRGASSLLCANK